jgi:radical SAM protein with 4Fe4S-binding SPASM domain
MSKTDAGELLAGRAAVQVFRATGDYLEIISPVIPTYRRRNAGSMTISLHRVLPERSAFGRWLFNARERVAASLRARFQTGPNEWLAPRPPIALSKPLAEMTMPCSALADGEAVDFPAGPFTTSPGELLALRVRTDATELASAPTVWLTDNGGERMQGHVACYVGTEEHGELGMQAELTYGGQKAEISIPKMLLYSPVSQCNLNCIHCISAHTRTSVNRLPDQIKSQMQAWAADGRLEIISSDYSGDILWADSRFGGELDFLFGLGIPFHIDTNGVCLTPEVSERLCRSRMASLNISLDAAEEATYKRVRKGAPPLREVVENIARFMEIRAAAGGTFPVSLSFTLMRSTLREWPDFLRLGARLGVDIVIARHLEAFTPHMEEDSLWHDQAAFNEARLEISTLAETLGIVATIPPAFSGVARRGRRPCTVPWNSAVVLGNGDVAACCVPGLVMGNLNENSMEEIWDGPRYRELRATVNSSKPLPPCASCPMFRQTDNPDSYLIHSAMRRETVSKAALAAV